MVLVVIFGIVWLVRKIESSDSSQVKALNPPDEPNDNSSDDGPPNDNPPDDNPPDKKDDNNDQNEEGKDCPYLNETNLTNYPDNQKYLKMPMSEEQLSFWKKIPQTFIVKCWKKGYHWHDILQLWEWKLEEKEISDLTSQERIGVINGLIYMPNPKMYDTNITKEEALKIAETNSKVGRIKDLIIMVRKTSNGETKVNIDKKFASGIWEKGGDRDQVKEIIKLVFQQENINFQHEISVLWAIGVQRFGNEWDVNCGSSHGSSGGSAICLALLSALHKKPISNKVAATGTIITSEKKGTINGQEIDLAPETNLPIAGLKEKVDICVEKGINHLVLSKYQSSPNLLTKKDDYNPSIELNFDDFQQKISTEKKEKIQVHWTENLKDLRELIFQNKLQIVN